MDQVTTLEELITYTIKIANSWPRVYISLKKLLILMYFNWNYCALITYWSILIFKMSFTKLHWRILCSSFLPLLFPSSSPNRIICQWRLWNQRHEDFLPHLFKQCWNFTRGCGPKSARLSILCICLYLEQ